MQFSNVCKAMALFEGFGKPGVPATRNHNPGNIVFGPWAIAHGAIDHDGGFAVFPDDATGFIAQDALVQHYAAKGFNIASLVEVWCPPHAPGNSPQNTAEYVRFVSANLGLVYTTLLNSIAHETPNPVAPIPIINPEQNPPTDKPLTGTITSLA